MRIIVDIQKNGIPNVQEAGYWGDNVCDVPEWTFRDMMQQISQNHPDIDFILMTGDFPPHDIWLQSWASNIEHSTVGLQVLKEYFPNTPVFPCLGNHDPWPANM